MTIDFVSPEDLIYAIQILYFTVLKELSSLETYSYIVEDLTA
jgi:hypothetical protein